MKEQTIDATNKKLGRLASEVASLLLGKDDPSARPHLTYERKVKVENASKMDISTKKLDNKLYKSYSGYPGGLKEQRMSNVVEKKGYSDVLRRAILGMLPRNKLRDRRMKNLEIKE